MFIKRFFLPLLTVLCCKVAGAAPFSIDWFTIDGGGVSESLSTGAVYSVSATIGQPDAGPPRTAGTFSLVGGFWALPAVQGSNTPILNLQFSSATSLRISWPSSLAGFALQQNTSLLSGNWTIPPETVNDDGINKFIIVNTAAGTRFFRLVKP